MATSSVDIGLKPHQIAEETFVIPWILEAPPVGYFPMNSLVIRGKEPVLVDTGSPANRQGWLENVASVVDPGDVRWIFLSHDDRDHAGNLLPALAACPNATLLTTWFSVGRMFEEWVTPLERCRFVNAGDSFDAGDRRLVALRPPLFDNPTTRALFDERTGVLWSVDTFATNEPVPLQEADELADDAFRDGQLLGGRLVAPWHQWLDGDKFARHVREVEDLPIEVIAGCHTPAIRGPRIDIAFELLRGLPAADPWSEFTQADLEQWARAMTEGLPTA
jgi:flavorubredoxin